MTSKVFVCHAKSDIEATSEIIDLLESTLELPAGALSTSSLPGYSSDARSDAELLEMLRGSCVVLALATEQSPRDATFCFELGAAWALGLRVVPVLTGVSSVTDLPWPLRNAPAVRPHDRSAWVSFVEDLARLLGAKVRVASAADVALSEITARASLPAPAAPLERSEIVALAAPQLSRELAFEAGRAMSDCVWNRGEALDFAQELSPKFGRFIDALGGSWQDLQKLADFEVWIGSTENLLQGLPADRGDIAEWYELGYQLTTLHDIAGEAEPSAPEDLTEREAVWREALEALLARAEAAHIRYEDIARVLAQLENLGGPAAARDFTNIARSLEELRKHAASADRLTSAA